MAPLVERERGHAQLVQVGGQWREAVAGGGILVGEHGERERTAGAGGICERPLEHEPVGGDHRHLEGASSPARSCEAELPDQAVPVAPSTVPASLSGIRAARISARLPEMRR